MASGEKINGGIQNGSEFPYAYHRASAYDPNMCSTARFTPPYANQPDDDDVDNNYENVILIPCNDSERIRDVSQDSVSTRSKIQNSYFIANEGTGYERNVEEQSAAIFTGQRLHQIPPCTSANFRVTSVGQTVHGEGRFIHQIPADSTETLIESQNGHIILHRSPNGHIYQNYYVNQDMRENGMVELVQIAESGHVYEQDYIQVKNTSELPPVEYNYHPKMPNNGELMEHLSDTTFVHLESSIIPEQGQEFLEDSYGQMASDHSSHIHVPPKDQQRSLLESTMSPLLAAVNDITQRDAELQSYLNQTPIRGSALCNEHCEASDQMMYRRRLASPRFNCAKEAEKPKLIYGEEDSDNENHCILVSDKPVKSRARASLPTNYLFFGKAKNETEAPSVFAKKEITLRTKFGPFEGESQFTTEEMVDVLRIQNPRTYPILLLEQTHLLDVSNENTSNWMRFVRMANTFIEQNLVLLEEDGKLYFKCCRIIKPKEELRVGYSDQYAQLYGLRTLRPTEEESQEIYHRENPWVCYECEERFPTSSEMQTHLNVHDDMEEDDQKEYKRRVKSRKKKKTLEKIVEVRKNSSRCRYCLKVFMTTVSLKKHIAQHLAEKRSCRGMYKNINSDVSYSFKCNICQRKFASDDKLKNHRLIHLRNEMKPYSCSQCKQNFSTQSALAMHIKYHTNRRFKCIFCQETFKHVADYKTHVTIHAINGIYTCHLCDKKYREFCLVRKHIKIFHSAAKYSCNECGRQFINMTFLRRHKLCHSDKRDFLCSECGKQFKRKDKLREHILRIHTGNKSPSRRKKKLEEKSSNDVSRYLELSPVKDIIPKQPKDPPSDLENYMYKCNECMIGFKRRGMLVNHMAKRHPEVHIDTIPELNLPIIKPQSLFFCQYCTKVYKSNGKRKVHILKNHPGQALPPSARSQPELSEINVKRIGNVKTEPQRCQWCYKQYASRNRLLSHYRKEHAGKQIDDLVKNQFTPKEQLDIYRPPNSPENKLLKLSSAALELSSLEDRKFFDFLNERSDDHSTITQSVPLDDHGNTFPKVDVNFKVVDGEYTETSSSTELNKLPQLFEESITCI